MCSADVLVTVVFVSEDSSRIFVAVGYGFFVEMTHAEALRFIDKKTSQLTASVHAHLAPVQHLRHTEVMLTFFSICFSFTEQLTRDSAKIKANIRMVLEVSLL